MSPTMPLHSSVLPRFWHLCALAVVCGLLAAGPALAIDHTLPGVLAHTFADSPDLAAARADLRVAQEEVDRARSGWRPTVQAYADATAARQDTDPGDPQDGVEKTLGASVSQPLYRGGSTIASVRGAKAALDAQRAALTRAEQALLLAAASAYMDVVEAVALEGLAATNRDVLAEERDAAQERFSLGDLTKTDVSQAEARLAGAEADLIRARGVLETRRAVFTQVTGLPLAPTDTLASPPEGVLDAVLPKALPEATARARAAAPRVRVAQGQARAAGYGVGAVRGELWPQVALNAGVDHVYDPVGLDYDAQTQGRVGVRATLPLYQGGAVRARLRQSQHEEARSRDVLATARRAAEREAVEAWTVLTAARAATRARADEVAAQRLAREGVREEAALGGRTVLDVLNADQEYLDAQAALVSAERAEVVARFALAAALGLLDVPS
ncbi:MAG: TolC family outer membrane protein [Alphaproteobacteria bacterium]|jgi:outer membrane protein|nr:TolC family outer membrane protein [Alphaproteobacteria bacterium]